MHAIICCNSGQCVCGSASEQLELPHVWEKSAQDIRMVSDLNAFSVAVLLFYLCFVMFLDMFAAFCWLKLLGLHDLFWFCAYVNVLQKANFETSNLIVCATAPTAPLMGRWNTDHSNCCSSKNDVGGGVVEHSQFPKRYFWIFQLQFCAVLFEIWRLFQLKYTIEFVWCLFVLCFTYYFAAIQRVGLVWASTPGFTRSLVIYKQNWAFLWVQIIFKQIFKQNKVLLNVFLLLLWFTLGRESKRTPPHKNWKLKFSFRTGAYSFFGRFFFSCGTFVSQHPFCHFKNAKAQEWLQWVSDLVVCSVLCVVPVTMLLVCECWWLVVLLWWNQADWKEQSWGKEGAIFVALNLFALFYNDSMFDL